MTRDSKSGKALYYLLNTVTAVCGITLLTAIGLWVVTPSGPNAALLMQKFYGTPIDVLANWGLIYGGFGTGVGIFGLLIYGAFTPNPKESAGDVTTGLGLMAGTTLLNSTKE